MSTSTFQNIRAALKAAIVTRLTTDSVTDVDVFEYWRPLTQEDQIFIGNVEVEREVLTMGGANRVFGEDITLELVVRTPVSGSDHDDLKVAEQRAEAVFASVENLIRNNDSIGGTLMSGEIDSFSSEPHVEGDVAVGLIRATLTFEANIGA